MKKCSLCDSPSVARGFCKTHWAIERKAGRIVPPPMDMASRFWRKVVKGGGPDDCWEWKGAAMDRAPYGVFVNMGRRELAHRVSFRMAFGDPGALCVCHRCDNPPCVRPDHLFLGTLGENTLDMWRKGRGRKGGNPSQIKFTAEKLAAAVELRARGLSQREIGEAIGLHQSHVSKVLRGAAPAWSR